jgi:hypothetical protein
VTNFAHVQNGNVC